MKGGRTASFTAVRHLLASPSIEGRTAPHVGQDDFDWSGLTAVAATMSAGEQLLVAIAQDLWTADESVGVRDLARRLDARAFDRVVEALRIARGEHSLDALPAAA